MNAYWKEIKRQDDREKKIALRNLLPYIIIKCDNKNNPQRGRARLETKPHPVLPCCVEAPGPEQIPMSPRVAQQAEAQSALLKHWPVMNCSPCPLPIWGTPFGSGLRPETAAPAPALFAGAAGGGGAAGAAPPPNPHPVLPCWVEAPGPEQIPMSPRVAQQAEAQSALFKHWPVMNCSPFPLPIWGTPFGSGLRPEAAAPAPALFAGAAGGAGGGGAAGAAPPPNPHPVLPCWVEAPGPEQIPMLPRVAQQADAQSALLKHWPVMNCSPFPLPT